MHDSSVFLAFRVGKLSTSLNRLLRKKCHISLYQEQTYNCITFLLVIILILNSILIGGVDTTCPHSLRRHCIMCRPCNCPRHHASGSINWNNQRAVETGMDWRLRANSSQGNKVIPHFSQFRLVCCGDGALWNSLTQYVWLSKNILLLIQVFYGTWCNMYFI